MKVLQILYSGLGGHGSVVTSLIDADKDREWEHQVLFYGIEDILPDYKKFCITRNIPFSFVKKERGALKTGGRAVKSVLKKYNPDVIILHSPGLIFFSIWRYCLLNRKKIFVVEHTSNDAKGFVELLAGFFAILLARKVVYLSPFYQQQMKRKFSLLPVLKRSVVIQNGIDLEKFKPSGKSVIEHELNAGMIGRFILPRIRH